MAVHRVADRCGRLLAYKWQIVRPPQAVLRVCSAIRGPAWGCSPELTGILGGRIEFDSSHRSRVLVSRAVKGADSGSDVSPEVRRALDSLRCRRHHAACRLRSEVGRSATVWARGRTSRVAHSGRSESPRPGRLQAPEPQGSARRPGDLYAPTS